MKTTVKIVNVNNVNQKNHLSRYGKQGQPWNSKDDKVLLECLQNAVQEGRSLVSGFRECSKLTDRTLRSTTIRYYQYLRPRFEEKVFVKFEKRPRQTFVKVEKTVHKDKKQTVSTTLDLHYATTKELFNKLSLEKKLQLISECISTSL